MEPKRGSVCVVARLTNRVSLHFEPTYIIRERSNRSTGFLFIIPFFLSFLFFSFFHPFPFVMKTLVPERNIAKHPFDSLFVSFAVRYNFFFNPFFGEREEGLYSLEIYSVRY